MRKDERPTSNAEHRMFNGKEERNLSKTYSILDVYFSFDIGRSMLDVRRSSFKTSLCL